MNKTDRLLEITRRIVGLERELAYLKAEFERLAGGGERTKAPRALGAVSIAKLVETLLAGRPEEVFSAEVVAKEVGRELESVRAALSKLCYAGRAERVAVGRYRYVVVKNPSSSG